MQYVERTHSCATSISILQRYKLSQLILPETALSDVHIHGVASTISNLFGTDESDTQIVTCKRRQFDDTKGFEFLSSLATHQRTRQWRGYFLAAGAVYALLTCMSDEASIVPLPGTVDVILDKLENHMYIDTCSIDALELLQPVRQSSSVAARFSSMFGWLNHTYTSCGGTMSIAFQELSQLIEVPSFHVRPSNKCCLQNVF